MIIFYQSKQDNLELKNNGFLLSGSGYFDTDVVTVFKQK